MSKTAIRLLLLEDEPDLRSTLRYNLKSAGYKVFAKENGKEGLALLDEEKIDLIVSDVMMPEMDGISFARELRKRPEHQETPLLFLTAKGEREDRLEGFRVGADDYLTKPFDLEELLLRVQVQARRTEAARAVRDLMPAATPNKEQGDLYAKVAKWEQRFPALAVIRRDRIVGQSPRMLKLLREILIRAPGKDPVLIVGETGAGKTGVAEAVHQLGPRANGAFRVVNCAELASADSAITLGKLFGYGKGSGLSNVPKEGQPGLLEDVDGGTLFLDEIHRLPLEAQAMLLLPIEGRPFHPAVGKGEPKTVDVKFLFATNTDLLAESEAGRFPFDLYQRLSASQIQVPPLSERREDIIALAHYFLSECREEFNIEGATFAPSLKTHLRQRDYPGNVRELRALVRELCRHAAFETDTVITLDHLPETFRPPSTPTSTNVPAATTSAPALQEVPGQYDDASGFWNEVEMRELSALRRHRFKIAAAEQELGLSSKSRTLTNHLRGMCFKALVSKAFDVQSSARLIVGRDDEALEDRTRERIAGYLDMVEHHTAAHSTKMLFNNLPRDYRKYVEGAVEKYRNAD